MCRASNNRRQHRESTLSVPRSSKLDLNVWCLEFIIRYDVFRQIVAILHEIIVGWTEFIVDAPVVDG